MILRKMAWALVLVYSLLMVSCSDDDSIKAPSAITTAYEDNKLELSMGEIAKLSPSFEAEGEPEYLWEMDGKTVSTEAVYNFESSQTGRFKLTFEVSNKSGAQRVDYSVRVYGPYSKGVFIVNEGWFGHEPGNVNFWDRQSDDIQHKVYEKENPDKKLGVTTQYACLNDSKLFLVSKCPDNLVVVNSETLKELGRVSLASGPEQARGFAYYDETLGFLSSSAGIYEVDLSQYILGNKIEGVSGEVGKMIVLEGKLFALKSKELLVINTTTLALEETITWEGFAGGMVVDKEGQLWISAGTQFVKVDPSSLKAEIIDLPEGFSVNKGWVWDAGCLTYSKQENALFFVKKGGWSAREVAKYDIETNTAKIICEIDSDYQIYGAGTYVDPVSNKLYVTAIKGFGQAANFNRLYVYNLDGTKEKVLDYEHFYFAALCVVNE
jgi:hypothetical protein